MLRRSRWKVEEEQWLLENCDKYKTWMDLTRAFSAKFRTVNEATIRHGMQLRGYSKKAPASLKYTKEEEAWLKDKLKKGYPHKEIVDDFNDTFTCVTGRVITKQSLSKFAESRGLSYGKRGDISISRRGGIANSKLNKDRQLPIGSESRNSKGFVVVKINNKPRDVQHNWKLKKVIEWERYNNKELPKGYMVVCLDRNEDNFAEDNLLAVNKYAAQSLYTLGKWNPSVKKIGVDWTKAFLLTAELRTVLKKNGVII